MLKVQIHTSEVYYNFQEILQNFRRQSDCMAQIWLKDRVDYMTQIVINVVFYPYLFSAAFITQTVCLDDVTIRFEIWDTAGQERYHTLAPMYYRNAQAAIIVYDITNQVNYVHC